jgi:hypothetical protein
VERVSRTWRPGRTATLPTGDRALQVHVVAEGVPLERGQSPAVRGVPELLGDIAGPVSYGVVLVTAG